MKKLFTSTSYDKTTNWSVDGTAPKFPSVEKAIEEMYRHGKGSLYREVEEKLRNRCEELDEDKAFQCKTLRISISANGLAIKLSGYFYTKSRKSLYGQATIVHPVSAYQLGDYTREALKLRRFIQKEYGVKYSILNSTHVNRVRAVICDLVANNRKCRKLLSYPNTEFYFKGKKVN